MDNSSGFRVPSNQPADSQSNPLIPANTSGFTFSPSNSQQAPSAPAPPLPYGPSDHTGHTSRLYSSPYSQPHGPQGYIDNTSRLYHSPYSNPSSSAFSPPNPPQPRPAPVLLLPYSPPSCIGKAAGPYRSPYSNPTNSAFSKAKTSASATEPKKRTPLPNRKDPKETPGKEKGGCAEKDSAQVTTGQNRNVVSGETKVREMVGKKSGKALLREEGLERTDNGMKQSSWPETPMINQKNYYTEYMKRDDQILTLRLQNEANRDKMIRKAQDKDRALAAGATSGDIEEDEDAGAADDFDASKVIVVHPGSQNLRIGFASDALPKTIPMTIAYKYAITESKEYEPRPKRQKLHEAPEQQFGEEFQKKFTKMSSDLKIDMRANKRKVLPNSKELVVNYNRRTPPEKIPEHNDPISIEWTDLAKDDRNDKTTYFTGLEAQRIPDDSKPPYKMFWPIQTGVFHENDYTTREALLDDFESILESALRKDLGLTSSATWDQYSCAVVIPDLYDKKYVEEILDMCLRGIGFKQVAFIQESLAATYGAGYTSACVVDVGAQKTSICCVEDGMCYEDSRINLKYGGYDVTETFVKMMLYDHFPYADINLKRRYDFLLAEELKISFCTMNQTDISVQLYNFHLRAPHQPTRKYLFKTYDEVILAPMGFYDPSIFDNSDKLVGRRKLIDRSYNAYDVDSPDDPTSSAQLAILTSIKPSLATNAIGFAINGNGNAEIATPAKEKSNPLNFLSRMDSGANGDSRVTSAAASPAPEGANTPVPSGPFVFGANGTNGGSPGPGNALQNGSHNGGTPVPPAGMFVDDKARTAKDMAAERDAVLPITPLDTAIITSIQHATKGDEKKVRDFFGGIMVIGGGAKTPGFGPFLEEKLKSKRPDLAEKVLVGTSPKEMDGQVVVWKGASVFARMKTHESWIDQAEFERLSSRSLHHKVLWNY